MDTRVILETLGIDIRRERGSEISCRCPLHDDRSPSFSINIDTGLWICYAGCGSGNLAQLVQRIKGGSIAEARRLAEGTAKPSAMRGPSTKSLKKRMEKRSSKRIPCPPYLL